MAMAGNNSAVLDVVVVENMDFLSHRKEQSVASLTENSLVQSPSLESFSTMQDIENLSELNVDENNDLSIKIDNPQKHLDTLETYITFQITTKVARIEFSESQYIVRRRYNDFIWLRNRLMESSPFCIIPPLPGKHSLMAQLDRYSKDFILLRMKALNVFINRVAQHPILSADENFKIFITANQPDFNMLRRQRSNSIPQNTKANVPIHNNLILKNRHPEFDKMKNYLITLLEKLNSIEKIASRVNKERIELSAELQYFYPVLSTWANNEPQLGKLLSGISAAIEKQMSAQNVLTATHISVIVSPLKDFTAYVDVVQEALHKRECYQAHYEYTMEELNKKKIAKDKLTQLPNGNANSGFGIWKPVTNEDKLEKLGVQIPTLVKKAESAQDSLECANEQLRSDIDRWQSEKQLLLKNILLEFAIKQVEYYEKSVATWEHVKEKVTHFQQSQSN